MRNRPVICGQRHVRRTAVGGFTLIETAMATVIIGVGVLSLVEAQTAFLKSNTWTSQSATANYLANEIRELTRRLPKNDPVNGLWINTTGGNTLQGWGPNAGAVTAADFNHLTAFDGMSFLSSGTPGWADGDLPGPIDAFGNVIPQITTSGQIQYATNGTPLPLQGWAQQVQVQKVDPFNSSVTYSPSTVLAANPSTGFVGLPVDQFPVRVTVTVTFRGPYDNVPATMAQVSWIVP